MSSIINSKKFAFELAAPKDLEGIMCMAIPPRDKYDDWEFIRCWVTTYEKMKLSTGVCKEPVTAIILNNSYNFPELQWGDEVVIRNDRLGYPPVLDVSWLKNVLSGKINPTPKEKPIVGLGKTKNGKAIREKIDQDKLL